MPCLTFPSRLSAALALALLAPTVAHAADEAEPADTQKSVPALSDPRIDLGFVVGDLETSKAFYEAVLGFKQTGGFTVEGPRAKAFGLTDGRPMTVQVMTAGSGPGATKLKLIEFPERKKEAYNRIDFHSESRITYRRSPGFMTEATKSSQNGDVTITSKRPIGFERAYAHTALGVGYFTYYVADLDETLARAAEFGAKPHAEGPVELSKKRSLAIISDPDGNLLELLGPVGE
ncbi:MAG: VOC family protein [Planctomycetota bacterium]